jgi:hypothetical protein
MAATSPRASPLDLPVISVILATPDGIDSVRKTLSHLRAQTIAGQLELVVVTETRHARALRDGVAGEFANCAVVELPAVRSIGSANAAGVRRARSPIVVLAEDHCFPDADWAEQLVLAHRGQCVAVGPAVRNANPSTVVSWADLFIGYGPWLEPVAAGPVDFLPGHNTSYKRDVLLAYGERLDSLMEAETLLHWDLRRAGHALHLAPAARVAHTNFSLWSSWIPVQYLAGRSFAGARAVGMSGARRAIYVVAAPLIPFVRLARLTKHAMRGPSLRAHFARALPALVTGLLLDGAGQMMGYLLGSGTSHQRLARFEYQRVQHVTERDQREVFAL